MLGLYLGAMVNINSSSGILIVDSSSNLLLICVLKHLISMMPSWEKPQIKHHRGLTWEEMAESDSAAFFPYNHFNMMFNELYRMAVPLFIPRHVSKHVYRAFIRGNIRSFGPPEDELLNVDHMHELFLTYDPW